MKTKMHFFNVSRSFLLRRRNVLDIFVEKNKTHILYSVTAFWLSCLLWDNVEKYCRVGQATDDNMAHAHFMLDTYGYKHTLTICNTHCFSIPTMAARTSLDVPLYVHSL